MAFKLTDKQIKSLIKKGEPVKKSVGMNLYFRISEEKTASWVYRYTMGDKRPEATIGYYPEMSLADACAMAMSYKKNVREGNYPLVEKQRLQQADFKTVNDLAEMVLRGFDTRRKHPHIPRRIYYKDIAPVIGMIPLDKVTPLDIKALLLKLNESGRPTIANDALILTKKIFREGIKLNLTSSNPADPFDINDAGGAEKERQRVLTKEEIKYVFAVFHKNNRQMSRENLLTVALCLLLGGRKGELLMSKWTEFDLENGKWKVPELNTKTKVSIVIPLCSLVCRILRELKTRACGSEHVFPTKSTKAKTPHRSLSTINAAINKMFKEGLLDIEHFTVHDLRRTCRTHLSKLGVPPHVAERCLNHKLKKKKDDTSQYDMYDYFDERKEALQKLADFLEPLMFGADNEPR